jgi:hypothetical protein
MKDLQKDIEVAVIPNFINESVSTVEWGEWKSAGPEEEMVEIIVNGKSYLLLEAYDGVPSGDPAKWTDDLDSDFASFEYIKGAGYELSKAIKAKKPIKFELWESEFVVRMEHSNSELIDYVLFAK